MTEIIVHTPQNEHSWGYRYYNIFFKNFIEFLKTKFSVEEDTYFASANTSWYNVKLLNDQSESLLLECEMIIENKKTKEFVVLSVSDVLTGAILNHKNNPLCKKIIFSQFDEENLKKHVGPSIEKFSPWIYFPSNQFDLDHFYNERLNKNELINKFCFWGTSLEDRKILNHFPKEYFDGGRPIGNFEIYANSMINYKVALSISGRAEFCYRDIENFAMGIPIIRFEYDNKMYSPLIPNYHYISIKKPNDLKLDRMGNEDHVDLLVNKFIEVSEDKFFLDMISKNARNYYDKFLSPRNSLVHTYNILNLSDWE